MGENLTLEGVLEKQISDISENVSKLNLDIKGLEENMRSLYNHFQKDYQLHGILIHKGSAIVGHYWAFIYNPDFQMWREYNDEIVSIVDVDQVTKTSEGDGKKKNQSKQIYLIHSQKKKKKVIHLLILSFISILKNCLNPLWMKNQSSISKRRWIKKIKNSFKKSKTGR